MTGRSVSVERTVWKASRQLHHLPLVVSPSVLAGASSSASKWEHGPTLLQFQSLPVELVAEDQVVTDDLLLLCGPYRSPNCCLVLTARRGSSLGEIKEVFLIEGTAR